MTIDHSAKFTVACVQYGATRDWRRDLDGALQSIGIAAAKGARLVALPELCVGLDAKNGHFAPAAFVEAEHPAIPALSRAAAEHGVGVLLGSIGVLAEDGRIFNRSFVFDETGQIAGRYDKLHLFDIDLGADGKFQESATIAPGGAATLIPCCGALLGMSVCYDVRFAALYRRYAQAGAQILSIPSAFTKVTGEAHWHVLMRARAIETGAFVIAPAQCGKLECGAECYGHSLVVDPWGRVLADAGDGPGMAIAEIDVSLVAEARQKIPAWRVEREFIVKRTDAVVR